MSLPLGLDIDPPLRFTIIKNAWRTSLSFVVGSGPAGRERGEMELKGWFCSNGRPNPGISHSLFAAHVQRAIILQRASTRVATDREMTEMGRQLVKPADKGRLRVPVSGERPL
jgi:hypothetical protein